MSGGGTSPVNPLLPFVEVMIVFKTVKSLFTLVVVTLCLSASFSASAGIGAEPSNQPLDVSSSAAMPLTSVPAAPEVLPGMGTDMMSFSQPYQMPSQSMPYMPGYGDASGMQPYQQQAPYSSGYGDVSGMMVPQYTNPSQSNMMPSYPSYIPMNPGTTDPMYGDSSMSQQMVPGYQNQPQYGSGPMYGDPSMSPQMVPGYQNQPQYGSGPMYGDPSMMPQMVPGYQNPPQYGSADQVYNQAMQAYRGRDYWTAMAKFREVASMYSQSDLADNAYYWMGEIYYAGKNYSAAIQFFQAVMQMYPQGNKVPDAMLKMAYAYAELRQYSVAKSILNDVAVRFNSNTRIQNLAVKKLNQLNSFY